MSRALILSVVTVVDRRGDFPDEPVRALHSIASSIGVALELVLVMNGCAPDVVEAAREQCKHLANVQVYVLKTSADHATATFAGLENAVGDWVATLDLERDEPAVITEMFRVATCSNPEVVLGVPKKAARHSGVIDAILSRAFHRLFRMLHGYSLAEQAPTARLLSRTVVNQVLRHDSPMVALQTLTARGGYRKQVVPVEPKAGALLPMGERIRARWQVLIGVNALPLRLANLLCGFGASVATLYSLYVVAIYLFKKDVMPGWTTVSLMLSGMFLLLSLVLWLISEYLILLIEGTSRRPRYETAEEFTSNIQTRRQHLNVEAEL